MTTKGSSLRKSCTNVIVTPESTPTKKPSKTPTYSESVDMK